MSAPADLAALVDRAPPGTRADLRRAVAEDGEAAVDAAHAALHAVGLTRGPLEPLSKEMLTKEQHAVALVLAHRELTLETHQVPRHAEGRQRMLGLLPEGPLDRLVDFAHGDDPPRVPLWRVLFVLRDKPAETAAFIHALELPVLERLAAFIEIERNPYGFDYTIGNNFPPPAAGELAAPGVAAWAVATATRMTAVFAAEPSPTDWWHGKGAGKKFLETLFEALVANDVPLDAAWDRLLPVAFSPYVLARKLLDRMPAERRGPACVRMLGWHLSSGKVACGLDLLALYPSRELTQLVMEHMDKVDHMPKRGTVKRLKEIAKTSAVVRDALTPAVTARPAVVLKVSRAFEPQSLSDLTPLQQEQLVAAGKMFDGKSWSAAVRLGLEIPKGRRPDRFEGSFAGWLEVRELSDRKGKPAYTAFLYLVDSGTIFVAGTTEVAATIVQSSLCEITDGALKEAFQVVIQPKARKKR